MRQKLLILILILPLLVKGQCNDENPSNSLENFLMMINGQVLAFDVDVPANTTFQLDELEANLMVFGASAQTYEVKIYDSQNSLPNNLLTTSTTTVLSDTEIGNFNGSPVRKIKLAIDNRYVVAATSASSKKIWIEIKFSGVGGAWEYSSASKIGLSGVANNSGTWIPTSESGIDYELVYKLSGTCGTLSSEAFNFEDNFEFFPNPTKDYIKIQSKKGEKFDVDLYDLKGKKIKVTLEKGKINLKGLSAGVYVLKVKTSKGVATKKIVKE